MVLCIIPVGTWILFIVSWVPFLILEMVFFVKQKNKAGVAKEKSE